MARFIMASSSGMRPCMAIMYCSGSGREMNERGRDRGLKVEGGEGAERSRGSGVEWKRRGEEAYKKDGLYQNKNTQLLSKMLLPVL